MGKRHKKIAQKKPRSYTVTLDMGQPVQANGFYYDPRTSQLLLLNDGEVVSPQSALVEQSYARATKSNKVLNAAPTDPSLLFANPNRILEQFDEIYAVDTNTKALQSCAVSIAGIVGSEQPRLIAPSYSSIRYRPILCMEFHDVNGKPENLAWMEVILAIRRSPDYSNKKRYAIVVDSDLGAIPGYNKREAPIYADFLLPKEFVLLYASADSGSENVTNVMLKLADKISTGIFWRLEQEWEEDGLSELEGKPYRRSRTWYPPPE